MNPQGMQGHELKTIEAVKALRSEFAGSNAGKIVSGGPPDDNFLRQAVGHQPVMDFYLGPTATLPRVPLATRGRGILAAWPRQTYAVI